MKELPEKAIKTVIIHGAILKYLNRELGQDTFTFRQAALLAHVGQDMEYLRSRLEIKVFLSRISFAGPEELPLVKLVDLIESTGVPNHVRPLFTHD